MKMFFLIMMGFMAQLADAQDQWMVYLNKKLVLTSKIESTEKNLVRVSQAELKNKQLFIVTYLEKPVQKGWTRSIMLFDSSDKELKRFKGKKLSFSNASLLSLLKKYQTLQVYTWSIPDDPALKERIRVRRVHLCTLVLE